MKAEQFVEAVADATRDCEEEGWNETVEVVIEETLKQLELSGYVIQTKDRVEAAEAIVRDMGANKLVPDIEDEGLMLCLRCLEPDPDHHMGCLVPRARAWVEESK